MKTCPKHQGLGDTMRYPIPMAALWVAAATVFAQEPGQSPWETTLSIGLSLTRGNSKTLLCQGSVTSERKDPSHQLRVGAQGSYGETEVKDGEGRARTDVNAQNARVFGEYRRVFASRLYGYFNAEAGHDRLADLRYRLLAGPGLGVELVKTDTLGLSADAGVSYLHDRFRDDTTDDTASLRLAERYEQKLGGTAKIWQSVEYLPSLEEFSDYLLTAELGSEAAINSRVNLRAVLQDKYDSTPASGRERNDLLLTAGLSCKL